MRAVQSRRAVLAAVVMAFVAGCAGWRVQDVPPKELLKDKSIEAVRVTRADKSKVEIYNPVILGDSIIGHPTEQAIARLVMPISQVQTIATRYHSLTKTMLAGIAILAAVAAYGLLQSLNQGQ